jgi:hypothetical protein
MRENVNAVSRAGDWNNEVHVMGIYWNEIAKARGSGFGEEGASINISGGMKSRSNRERKHMGSECGCVHCPTGSIHRSMRPWEREENIESNSLDDRRVEIDAMVAIGWTKTVIGWENCRGRGRRMMPARQI